MAMASSLPPRWSWRILVVLAGMALAGLGVAVRPAPATAQDKATAGDAGAWDLSFEKGNRRCRLTLRPETAQGGYMLSMPAGCHRAFPLLAGVTAWLPFDSEHVLFLTPDGATVLDFAPRGGPFLQATIGEDADTYLLTPVALAVRDRIMAAAAGGQDAPAVATALVPTPAPLPTASVAAPAPAGALQDDGVMVGAATPTGTASLPPQAMLPPVSLAQVPGNYAVLRQNRDTGCMVTLDAAAGHPDGKARLAPACRDQGIVIFDPARWELVQGQLVLLAKRGHKTLLSRRQDLTWATTPAKGVALVLKRL